DEELLIERGVHTGTINPGDSWQTLDYDGPVARLVYRIRVRCDENYYGNKCNKLCVPRDDYFGHYRCDPSGTQVCLDGWMGPDCRTGLAMIYFLILAFKSENLLISLCYLNNYSCCPTIFLARLWWLCNEW
ncbi:Protein jagged-2, partial [Xenoophorus captivus]